MTNRTGFYIGLGLIALGSGGIKPCVAAFVGDQFDQTNKHRAKVVFDAFYWIINFGSFFASLLMPIFLRHLGPAVAFGIPGVLMFISTVDPLARAQAIRDGAAGAARSAFVPARVAHGARFRAARPRARRHRARGAIGSFAAHADARLRDRGLSRAGGADRVRRARRLAAARGARGKHPDEAIEGVRAVLRVLVLFALVTPFWSLFDQKASTWVLQADAMTKPNWFQPSQMQALNPALVMLLIPFNNLVLYPGAPTFGIRADGVAPHDRRHRLCRSLVDRRRLDAAGAR